MGRQGRSICTANISSELSRAAGYTVFLTEKDVVFSMKGASDRMAAIRMEFEGGQAATRIEPVEQLPGKSNYMVGDRASWRKDVPQFAKVRYQNIYPQAISQKKESGSKTASLMKRRKKPEAAPGASASIAPAP